MTSPPVQPTLRIVVVTGAPGGANDQAARAQAVRAAALRSGLRDSSYDIIASLPADPLLPGRIARIQPDLIVIHGESDACAVLGQLVIATRSAPCPIVLFTDDPDPTSMDAALDAGVAAYVVAGLQAGRVKPVLDLALARFKRERKLADELLDARRQLAERKLIERAKGMLMARKDMTEDQAYQALRRMAMNKKLRLAELAQRILDAGELL